MYQNGVIQTSISPNATSTMESQFSLDGNSNDMCNMYGKYLLKCRVITDNYLNLNNILFPELTVKSIMETIKSKIGREEYNENNLDRTFNDIVKDNLPLNTLASKYSSLFNRFFRGVLFYGGHDGNVILSYDVNSIIPISYHYGCEYSKDLEFIKIDSNKLSSMRNKLHSNINSNKEVIEDDTNTLMTSEAMVNSVRRILNAKNTINGVSMYSKTPVGITWSGARTIYGIINTYGNEGTIDNINNEIVHEIALFGINRDDKLISDGLLDDDGASYEQKYKSHSRVARLVLRDFTNDTHIRNKSHMDKIIDIIYKHKEEASRIIDRKIQEYKKLFKTKPVFRNSVISDHGYIINELLGASADENTLELLVKTFGRDYVLEMINSHKVDISILSNIPKELKSDIDYSVFNRLDAYSN
jgi:hypothetical protein